MRRIAYNDKAALFMCGREYWIVKLPYFACGCYEERSDTYNARDALAHFELEFGKAEWTHEAINSY